MKGNAPPISCELAVKAIVPSVRAMLAKELISGHLMKQQEVATALGLTQSAISQYLRNVRGTALNLQGMQGIDAVVREMAEAISNGSASFNYINGKYCEICRQVRETRLLCELHKRVNPDYEVEGCTSCAPAMRGC